MIIVLVVSNFDEALFLLPREQNFSFSAFSVLQYFGACIKMPAKLLLATYVFE